MEASLLALTGLFFTKMIPWMKCLCKKQDICIVIPAHCGKSRLLNSIDINYKNKYLFCDINADVWASLNQEQKSTIENYKARGEFNTLQLYVLPIYKKFMCDLKERFPNKRICFLMSDLSLAKLLDIKFFLYIIPSQDYLLQICNGQNDTVKKEIRESVSKMIQLKGDKCIITNNFDSILSIIQKHFNIKLKY